MAEFGCAEANQALAFEFTNSCNEFWLLANPMAIFFHDLFAGAVLTYNERVAEGRTSSNIDCIGWSIAVMFIEKLHTTAKRILHRDQSAEGSSPTLSGGPVTTLASPIIP